MTTAQSHTPQSVTLRGRSGPSDGPKSLSRKQLRANRRNAEHSTGPRTPEGKAKVAQNAVKHGLCAQRAIIPGEDPSQLTAMREDLLIDLQPADSLEQLLVDRIATAAWRLKRATRYEVSLIEDAIADAERSEKDGRLDHIEPETIGARAVAACLAGAQLRTLSRYEGGIERGMFRAIKELREIRRSANSPGAPGRDALDPMAEIDAQIRADLQRFRREQAEFDAAMEELHSKKAPAADTRPQAVMPQGDRSTGLTASSAGGNGVDKKVAKQTDFVESNAQVLANNELTAVATNAASGPTAAQPPRDRRHCPGGPQLVTPESASAAAPAVAAAR